MELQRGVDARHEALHCRLLVAGGAVELSRAVQTGNGAYLQSGGQGQGVDAVVLDGVGGAHDDGVLQTGDGVEHLQLHLLRHGGGEALHVQLLGAEPHRLDEQLVAGLVGEAHHLRLDGRAVPGADTLDDAGVDGAAVKVLADDAVGLGVGIRQVADGAVLRHLLRGEAEGQGRVVAGLHLHFAEVHAAAVDAGRRTGLEAAQGQSHGAEAVRQGVRRVGAVGAGGLDALAHDGLSPEVGAGAEDDRLGAEHRAGAEHHGGDVSPLVAAKLRDLSLTERQTGLQLKCVLHHLLVFLTIRLRPQRPDGGTLAAVEHTVLDAGFVGGLCHLAAQRVQLADKVSLAGAADGGVAGHIAHGFQTDRQADGVHTHACRRQRCLDTRVAGSDHGNVVVAGVKFCHRGSPRNVRNCNNTLLYYGRGVFARGFAEVNLLDMHK